MRREPASPLPRLIRQQIGDQLASYEEREYIHLLDGGLSGNLGLANGIAALSMIGDYQEAIRAFGHEDLELILVITVNAEAESEHPWDAVDQPASICQRLPWSENLRL